MHTMPLSNWICYSTKAFANIFRNRKHGLELFHPFSGGSSSENHEEYLLPEIVIDLLARDKRFIHANIHMHDEIRCY